MIGSLGAAFKAAHLTVNTRVVRRALRKRETMMMTLFYTSSKKKLSAHTPSTMIHLLRVGHFFSFLSFYFNLFLLFKSVLGPSRTLNLNGVITAGGQEKKKMRRRGDVDRPTESIILIIEAPLLSLSRSLAGRLQNFFSSLEYNTNAIGQSST